MYISVETTLIISLVYVATQLSSTQCVCIYLCVLRFYCLYMCLVLMNVDIRLLCQTTSLLHPFAVEDTFVYIRYSATSVPHVVVLLRNLCRRLHKTFSQQSCSMLQAVNQIRLRLLPQLRPLR